MLNLPAQAGFRAEGAWHRAGAWGPCAAGKLAAAHTSPGRCSLRLSLLSSPHPVGGTETSLQDSRPLSGGHPSIRACLRGRQRAWESGAGVLDTPPTKVAPRWPHAPQTSRGTREPRTSPWESPGQGGGGRPTNPGGVRAPASLWALSKALCAGRFTQRGPGEPDAELGVCPRGSCGDPRDTGRGAPGLGACYPEPGSLPDRAGTVGTGQGTPHGLSPEQAGAQGRSAQCGRTPSWLGVAGPEAQVGAEVPRGWPLCRDTHLASPGSPQGRPGRRGVWGQPGAGRQQPR